MRSARPEAIILSLVLLVGAAAQTPLVFRDDDDALVEKVREFDAAFAKSDWRFVTRVGQEIIDAAIGPAAVEDLAGAPASAAPEVVARLYPDPLEPGVSFAADRYVIRRLTTLPADALEAFIGIQEARAEEAARGARLLGGDEALGDVGRRFPLTSAGVRALTEVAHRDLARGALGEAARGFEDLLDVIWRPELRHGLDPAAIRAGLALSYAGLGEHALLDQLGREAGDSEVAVAGRERRFGAWTREELAPFASAAPLRPASERPHAGPDGPLAAVWTVEHERRISARVAVPLMPEPVVSDGVVYYHTRDFARALDLTTGRILWTKTFGGSQRPGDRPLPISDAPSLRHLRGHLGRHVYVLVTAARVRATGEEARTVVALRRDTGTVAWITGADAVPDVRNLSFDPAPRVGDERVFVTATDRAGGDPRAYALALDVRDGRPLWISRIGGGVALPFKTANGDVPPVEHWLGCLPMAAARGLLFVVDNLGSFAALETRSGRPRFAYRYPRRQVENTARFDRTALPRGWDSSPVLLDGDRVVFAPDDSDEVYFFYTHPPTDEPRRRANKNFLRADTLARAGLERVVGFRDGVAIVAGIDAFEGVTVVRAFSPFPGAASIHRWDSSVPLDTPVLGRACAGEKNVYVCSHKYVYRIDLESGAVSDPLLSDEADGTANLGSAWACREGLLIASLSGIRYYR